MFQGSRLGVEGSRLGVEGRHREKCTDGKTKNEEMQCGRRGGAGIKQVSL